MFRIVKQIIEMRCESLYIVSKLDVFVSSHSNTTFNTTFNTHVLLQSHAISTGGGHWGSQSYGVGKFFMQYFGNFNPKFQYCSILWTNSQNAFFRFLSTNKSVNQHFLHIYPPFSGNIPPPPLHFTTVGFKPLCYANYVMECAEFFVVLQCLLN